MRSRPTPTEDARTVEDRTIEMVREVRRSVRIPLAVKLSPFYTSFANFARRLDDAGPAGLVLFNRFWQPGIDVEELEVRRELHLSDSSELPLRLRWLAILSGNVRASLAVTGGVHTVLDVVQAVMAGAHAVQMVSALLHHGPEHLAVLRRGLVQWLEEHEYGSLREMRGSMSMRSCPDPAGVRTRELHAHAAELEAGEQRIGSAFRGRRPRTHRWRRACDRASPIRATGGSARHHRSHHHRALVGDADRLPDRLWLLQHPQHEVGDVGA